MTANRYKSLTNSTDDQIVQFHPVVSDWSSDLDFGWVRCLTSNKPFDFGTAADHDSDWGISNGNFTPSARLKLRHSRRLVEELSMRVSECRVCFVCCAKCWVECQTADGTLSQSSKRSQRFQSIGTPKARSVQYHCNHRLFIYFYFLFI